MLALLSIGEGQVPVWIMRKLSADTISHKKIALCIEGSSTIPGSISCNIPFQQAFSNCSAPEKGCNFSCEKEGSQEKLQPFSGAEQLEKACWNGMLHEILPGIVEEPSIHRAIFLWEIVSAESFLIIQTGTCPSPIDNRASIDPYRFVSTLLVN